MFEDDNDKPPTSKDEADARRVRPPPEKYDPDKLSHWSITMTLAWGIWGEIDAVRNEWDDYRDKCADWRFVPDATARAKLVIPDIQKDLQKESSWHFHQWEPSGWRGLCLRAISKNLPPQVALDELWQAAGEGRIKATARECKNAKTFDGDLIEIPAHYWARLKRVDDRLTGKAMLSDDEGRVYREIQFPRLDVKELWPKSPPLSGEPLDSGAVEVLPAEPESPTLATASKKTHPQSERAARYIDSNFPRGTEGITTATIREKLAQDEKLQEELKELGRKLFSATVINRVLGRRKK